MPSVDIVTRLEEEGQISSFSCVTRVRREVQVSVPFAYLDDGTRGVSSVLSQWKGHYIRQAGGFVVDFSNVRILKGTLGRMATAGAPHALLKARVTFTLYRPSVGAVLRGVVNRMSRDHVGCVVDGAVNGSMPMPSNVPLLALDRPVYFEVTQAHLHKGMVRVQGEVTEECVQLMELEAESS